MTGKPYTYLILRYSHDPVAEEFLNIGAALLCPSETFFEIKLNKKVTRLAAAFGVKDKDAQHFRYVVKLFEKNLHDIVGERLDAKSYAKLPFKENLFPENVDELFLSFIPKETNSFHWSEVRGGFTDNPKKTLEDLYDTYVGRYQPDTVETRKRTEIHIRKNFVKTFKDAKIFKYINNPITIKSKLDSYKFEFNWKNGIYHVFHPFSLDLETDEHIINKSHLWRSKLEVLSQGELKFKPFLIIAEPKSEKLSRSVKNAKNILSDCKIKTKMSLISEADVPELAKDTKRLIKKAG